MAPRGSGRSQELQLLRAIGANYGRLRSFSALGLWRARANPYAKGARDGYSPCWVPTPRSVLCTSAHKRRPGGFPAASAADSRSRGHCLSV